MTKTERLQLIASAAKRYKKQQAMLNAIRDKQEVEQLQIDDDVAECNPQGTFRGVKKTIAGVFQMLGEGNSMRLL